MHILHSVTVGLIWKDLGQCCAINCIVNYAQCHYNCRFWEKGYWKSHLGNRRYHISALYLVDLVTFRQLAAGDRLRGQYQALSQDPNSLSNLDQDLPNNMIHSVPIKSLPQEWLWCETWCSQESKAQAKTIDLVWYGQLLVSPH